MATSADCLFFSRPSTSQAAAPSPGRWRVVRWRPTWREWQPPGPRRLRFLLWWLFHHVRLFSNRDYGALVVFDDGAAVHRSCMFPRYFRFPFMAVLDLQIGDTWTAPHCQERGLATLGLCRAVDLESREGRVFWYVADRRNHASIRVAEKAGFTLTAEGVRTRRLGLRALGAFVMVPTRR